MLVKEKVKEVIKNILVDEDVQLNTSIHNSNKWDSLNHLKILVGLEKEFSCTLSLDDLVEVESVHDWVLLIEKTIRQ